MATATKNIYAEKIQGNLSITSVSATSISATTYYNLPSSTVTTIYNGDGILSGNRIVNLSSYTLNFSSSTNPNTLVMSGGNVGIGITSPLTALHVSSASDPLTLDGVQEIDDNLVLTLGANNVVHSKPLFLSNTTNDKSIKITQYQSIFNPSDLIVTSLSTFRIDSGATYYVLGDFYNSGQTIVNGTLKVGGIIYNSGTITGSGIIE